MLFSSLVTEKVPIYLFLLVAGPVSATDFLFTVGKCVSHTPAPWEELGGYAGFPYPETSFPRGEFIH